MSIKITEEDHEYVLEVYKLIRDAILEAPHELQKSERFGGWAVMALTNMLCHLLKSMKLSKESAYKLLCEVWDGHNMLN